MAFTPLAGLLARALAGPSTVAAADAIVVLASMVGPDGTLSSESLRRTLGGILLERRGLAPLLVLSGSTEPGGRSEAEARARLAGDLGVPAERLLTLAGVHTTRDEAARAAALLHPRGVRRILLVTSSYHIGRASGVFERAGFEVLPAPADGLSHVPSRPGSRLALAWLVSRELAARAYHRLASLP
jgi:uncharacterized SAM-binding protein YcdF (DUF218 family)